MMQDTDNHASATENQTNEFDPDLLRILVCPFTKTRLVHDQAKNELVSKAGHVAFPIREGIPLLIRDAARPIEDGE